MKAKPTVTKTIRLPAALAEAASTQVEDQHTSFNAYMITLICRDLGVVPVEKGAS
jgi:hypothetical protein